MIEDQFKPAEISAQPVETNGEADRAGYRKPPEATRFKPGQSGNPAGRQRKVKTEQGSSFTLILGKNVLVRRNGKVVEHSVEEALQLRTYQEALKGKGMAVREVLRWILRRETWLAKHKQAPQAQLSRNVREDPDNADEAMILLGIASRDPKDAWRGQDRDQLLLEPWVVKAAFSRSRRARSLNNIEQADRTIEDARAPGYTTSRRIDSIIRQIITPGSVNSALETLHMAKLFNGYWRDNARILLEPWIVEAALSRMDTTQLTAEQRNTIINATIQPM